MKKVVFIFLIAIILILPLFWLLDSSFQLIFTKLMDSFFPILTVFGATTIAFANYLDSVLKDIPEEIKNRDVAQYDRVVNSILDLKDELISNVIFLIGLILISLLLLGLIDWNGAYKYFDSSIFDRVINSFRLAIFCLVIYIVYSQINSFRIANKFKKVILLGNNNSLG